MGDRSHHYNGSPSYVTSNAAVSSSGAASSRNLEDALTNLSIANSTSHPFEDLTKTEYLLLLTPYLHAPPPQQAHLTTPMDPFEPFGRKLAAHHANIRHVPYVAKNGMLELHEHLLDDAGGVVVVICEPPVMRGVSDKHRLDGLKYQERFAKAVAKYLHDQLGDEVPNAIVTVDAEDFQHTSRYHAAFELDDWDELDEVADDIFGKS